MKILVLNAGSSSVKFKIYLFPHKRLLISGSVEKIKESISYLNIEINGVKKSIECSAKNHKEALENILNTLIENRVIENFSDIQGVGHRVVHGGEHFSNPVIINSEVKEKIRQMIPLAPLHNPANLEGIEVMESLTNTPQVAVFDTAFHQSMPMKRYLYALPMELYRDESIRRYGFHGTSHSFVSKRASEILSIPYDKFNAISLHLGNGASVCAIEDGKSIDTSMGMTPLEGLVMGTRCGDIDPAITLYLINKGYSPQEIDTIYNKKSGLIGLADTNDMREIEELIDRGDKNAQLAFDIFIERVVKYIGAYYLMLQRVDAIIFTGGIGEHSVRVKEAVCERLKPLGIFYDSKKILNSDDDFEFHSKESRVAILKIKTDEELEIANIVYSLV